jgi:hypothetical protein
MAYIDPNKVLSPQRSVSNLRVIWNGGQWDKANPAWSGWSLSELDWDGNPAVGCRWNGADDEERGVGNPQSRGLPTWFILPGGIADVALQAVIRHRDGGDAQPDAPVSPRRRLLDLITFVRAASDEELTQMLAQMDILGPRTAEAA